MSKTLIVAEKPSVAQDIARVVKARQKGEGCLMSDAFVVTWAVGHLLRLAEPDEIDPAYKRWTMDALPILPPDIPRKAISKTRTQLMLVRRLMRDKEIERIICATDAGREGELIFRWIYEAAGIRKPVERLWISSMTDEAISAGMAALRPSCEYDALYQSALCRAKADWLIGMNLSRVFTLKYDALLSVGRVQTPTLALLVARQKEIDAFVPQTYFQVEVDFGAYRGTWFDPAREPGGEKNEPENRTRIAVREQASLIVQAVQDKTGEVKKAEITEKKELAPQLYDLTALQREANRQFGFSAKKTLNVAQELYEKYKLITYPRTESRLLPMDMRMQAANTMAKLPAPYDAFAPLAMENARKMGAGRVFQKDIGSDHHALIPTTKRIELEKLPPDERKVLELILKRFLAAFYPPYRYLQQRVETQVGEHWFQTTGREEIDPGWKAVEKPATKEKNAIPHVAVGDEYAVEHAETTEHQTKPPLPYTDASLLYAMEHAGRLVEDEQLRETMKKHGLGTPATRAAIIERLLTVHYAKRSGKSILPTEKGMQLTSVMPPQIASPETTEKWEYALNRMAEQRQADEAFRQRFMKGIEQLTAEIVAQVKQSEKLVSINDPKRAARRSRPRGPSRAEAGLEGMICPVCGKGGVRETDRAFCCTKWRDGCEFTIWKDAMVRDGGPVMTEKLLRLLLEKKTVKGSTGVVELTKTHLRFYMNNTTEAGRLIPIEYKKRK